MDGDIVALPEVLSVASEFDCLVMVDEAHSFWHRGEHGWGLREHYGLPGDAVDAWMGTLSKSLASCGGFVAGNGDLMWALRSLGPGGGLFIAPPTAAQIAASIAAFEVLRAEPQRVGRLRANAAHALAVAREAGQDTGTSAGTPIVPLITGDTIATIELSTWLWQSGVNASPIPQAAVGDGQDRIRLFLSSEHRRTLIGRELL